MRRLMFSLFILCFSLKGVAQEECMLEGMGSFELNCQDSAGKVQAHGSGTDALSMSDFSYRIETLESKRNPEADTPPRVFERVDENVFTLSDSNSNASGYIQLMGIPRSFEVKSIALSFPPGAIESTGNFTALVYATLFKSSGDVSADTQVSCQFKMVGCARPKIEIKK